MPVRDLTETERRYLQAAAFGMTGPDTAALYGRDLASVKHGLARARRILRAKNTTHAVAEAWRRGLIV